MPSWMKYGTICWFESILVPIDVGQTLFKQPAPRRSCPAGGAKVLQVTLPRSPHGHTALGNLLLASVLEMVELGTCEFSPAKREHLTINHLSTLVVSAKIDDLSRKNVDFTRKMGGSSLTSQN